jgi:hypothetical protein
MLLACMTHVATCVRPAVGVCCGHSTRCHGSAREHVPLPPHQLLLAQLQVQQQAGSRAAAAAAAERAARHKLLLLAQHRTHQLCLADAPHEAAALGRVCGARQQRIQLVGRMVLLVAA